MCFFVSWSCLFFWVVFFQFGFLLFFWCAVSIGFCAFIGLFVFSRVPPARNPRRNFDPPKFVWRKDQFQHSIPFVTPFQRSIPFARLELAVLAEEEGGFSTYSRIARIAYLLWAIQRVKFRQAWSLFNSRVKCRGGRSHSNGAFSTPQPLLWPQR